MSSLTIKQGDILVLDIPFSDFSETKKRPTLVISSTRYNQQFQDIIVASITSQPHDQQFHVRLSQIDLVDGQLKRNSSVKADHPTTVHKKLIERRVGAVSVKKLAEIKQKMKELYEL
jgi:mRNA interferase MazF